MSTENPLRRTRFRLGTGRATKTRAVAGLTALLLPLAAMVGLAAPAEAATSATASYVKKSDWGSGFEGQWTVKNTGTTALSSWTIEWDFPSGTAAGSAWDATVTSSGNHWTAKNLGWNGSVAPGASVSFGFNGTGAGAPTGCKLNGASCDGGSVPGDNAPSAPGTPTASGITDTSVKLSWTAATDDNGIKNYDVLRDGAVVSTVTGTTYTDSGLKAGTDYSYTVQARDTAGQTGPVSGAVKVHTTGGGGGNPDPGTGGKVNLGYFTDWGVYGRNYHVKNLDTSGSAAKITHINYAFGNVQGGKCTIGDSYADYDMAYTADKSVDGVADTWDQPLRGSFNQLRKLKAKYPHIKVLWSFGGWTWSGGFGEAAKNPAAFADSCYNLVEDPRWADVFDGIDIDWEYPNACGLTCDTSGPAALKGLTSALRTKFGKDYLVTAAITADGSDGGKIDLTDYAGAA
ncbi:glycosyl hydrolase family 18 protein, partial [Streptomyces sp. NPDC052095]|uniref:glycosyl hydrolase family 18 protein n=1 Tax=unclassified Streptomyces TaxID=2593676 RepID=UPI003450C45B